MTVEQLRTALRRAPEAWLQAVVDVLDGTELDTPEERAAFVAQLAHESAEFTRLTENLNYSAERLAQVWPSKFRDPEVAKRYARNPERLANFVYANRLGNGPEASGDGWRYRGRGPIQLTGRENYTRCGMAIGVDLLADPDRLFEPEIGIRSALWFWRVRNLDRFDDDGCVRDETRLVNGGTHGLDDRQAYYEALHGVLTA